MLCVKCKKNMAVVYITQMDMNGNQKNEGYCLTCAKELNLGPVNEMMDKMGISPEEMDSLNQEMMEMMDEFGGEDGIDLAEGMQMLRGELGGELDESGEEDLDEEESGKSRQRDPFEMMSRFFGAKNNAESETAESKSQENGKTKAEKKEKSRKKRKVLELYGTNLTDKARCGQIDRVIGRDVEMLRVAQILNRRTKNNPVLIGEPGVGKTAIAEGLALKIVNGDVPAKLLNYEIYLLDMTAVLAGTQFRGQFESRLKNILDEVKKAGNIILVIDEVHSIATAGDAEGAMSAGNIMKPALAKGEIQIIGATTPEEYRKYIEKDSALERRFQPVSVDEPSVGETVEILKGIKEYYEDYHKVRISDDVIRAAAVLSERYITDRFLPDKAIDVIDEAASRANLNNTALVELEKLKQELQKIQSEKESAANADSIEDYQKAAELKSRECQLQTDIAALTEKSGNVAITSEDIAAVIEGWTKIPVRHITEYETNRLINLEQRLHARLIGQDKAVEAVSRGIRRKRAGISLKRRPASFIFVGPTGVGKTELVKQIAREVFDSEEALIRLDMSEYMEKHAVSKLIGSPPGYVGYDDAGQLTEKIRRRPYSVILLDEIEKAHPDIFNMLLQILDDGKITDSHGKTVSFENTIIIMTSNAGSDQKSNVVGFQESDEAVKLKVHRALKELFRPEFLNRVDEIVTFDELTKPELLQITSLLLSDLAQGLQEKQITLSVSDAAKELILEKAYDKAYGARPLRRYIERHIEDALAQMVICGQLCEGDQVEVERRGDEFEINPVRK